MKKLLTSAVLFLALLASPCVAQVVPDSGFTATGGCSVPSSASNTGVTTAAATGVTLSASDNALVVMVLQLGGGSAITGVSGEWDSSGTPVNTTFSQTAANSAQTVWFLGLRSPATGGSKTFTASWTNAAQVQLAVCGYGGVNVTSDAAAFNHFNSATGSQSSPQSITITAGSSDYALAAFTNNAQNYSSVNKTEVLIQNTGSVEAAAANGGAGPNPTFTATSSGTNQSIAAGLDIAAAGGGGGATCGSLALKGQGC